MHRLKTGRLGNWEPALSSACERWNVSPAKNSCGIPGQNPRERGPQLSRCPVFSINYAHFKGIGSHLAPRLERRHPAVRVSAPLQGRNGRLLNRTVSCERRPERNLADRRSIAAKMHRRTGCRKHKPRRSLMLLLGISQLTRSTRRPTPLSLCNSFSELGALGLGLLIDGNIGSPSFQRARKTSYRSRAEASSPILFCALAICKCASAPIPSVATIPCDPPIS
jgi:hypothetical protein